MQCGDTRQANKKDRYDLDELLQTIQSIQFTIVDTEIGYHENEGEGT